MNLPVLQECAPYRAKVTQSSCAARWRMAQRELIAAEGFLGCRTCEVGKSNAEQLEAVEPTHSGARTCTVCGTRFQPQHFKAYSAACSAKCRSVLMREVQSTNVKARAKKKGKAA